MSEGSVAGPSNVHFSPPPPPNSLKKDDYSAADQARQRFSKHSFLSNVSLSLPHPHWKRKNFEDSPRSSNVDVALTISPNAPDLVEIAEKPNDPVHPDESCDKDVYRWAVLYENQRGVTVFSTAKYSSLTLLPLDPPPFTIPTALVSPRRNQPTVTLEDYPLPDGSWKWISRSWLIDMRGDGEVQYDGFEYARSFRSKQWSPNPGFMSNRGLVRRRRWIRLMMRPAHVLHGTVSFLEDTGTLLGFPELRHYEEGTTQPPSVMLTASHGIEDDLDVWKGDNDDWQRCHIALHRLGRDGRKLELWARWLGVTGTYRPSTRASSLYNSNTPLVLEATESEARVLPEIVDTASTVSNQSGALSAETDINLAPGLKECVAGVLRGHGWEILNLFIYPESRAQFICILTKAALLQDLKAGLDDVSDSVSYLDFWSYTTLKYMGHT